MPRNQRRYTHVISLGDNCQPSYQIERHFRIDDAYPFDRWVTSFDGLALYLDTLAVNVYQPADLSPLLDDGIVIGLYNRRYDFRFYHEFPKDGFHPKSAILPEWEAYVASATDRTLHLIDKFVDLDRASNSVLFVRIRDWVSGQPLNGREMTQAEAFERVAAGLENRFPSATFDLLCLNFTQRCYPPMRGEVIHLDIANSADDWRGSNDLWSGVFNHIGAQLVKHAIPTGLRESHLDRNRS